MRCRNHPFFYNCRSTSVLKKSSNRDLFAKGNLGKLTGTPGTLRGTIDYYLFWAQDPPLGEKIIPRPHPGSPLVVRFRLRGTKNGGRKSVFCERVNVHYVLCFTIQYAPPEGLKKNMKTEVSKKATFLETSDIGSASGSLLECRKAKFVSCWGVRNSSISVPGRLRKRLRPSLGGPRNH